MTPIGRRQSDLLGRYLFLVMLVLGCIVFAVLCWYWVKVVAHQDELQEYLWERALGRGASDDD